MQIATMYGNIAAMEVLVQHVADVHGSLGTPWQCDAGYSPAWRCPLHIAALHKQYAAIAWLLQQGITAKGSGLGLALERAAKQADTRLMRMLLSYSPTQAALPSHGTSALLTAVKYGHVSVAEELLKAGVPTTAQAIQYAKRLGGEGAVCRLLRGCLSWTRAYEQSSAILQAAVQHGHVEFAELLREARAAAATAVWHSK
jgi:hypothetical protein